MTIQKNLRVYRENNLFGKKITFRHLTFEPLVQSSSVLPFWNSQTQGKLIHLQLRSQNAQRSSSIAKKQFAVISLDPTVRPSSVLPFRNPQTKRSALQRPETSSVTLWSSLLMKTTFWKDPIMGTKVYQPSSTVSKGGEMKPKSKKHVF